VAGLGEGDADEAQFLTLPASIATARAYQSQSRGDIHGSVKYGRSALELLLARDHHMSQNDRSLQVLE
jgi:hypothetical protein